MPGCWPYKQSETLFICGSEARGCFHVRRGAALYSISRSAPSNGWLTACLEPFSPANLPRRQNTCIRCRTANLSTATPIFWQFAGLLALIASSFVFDKPYCYARLPFRPDSSEAAAWRFMLGTALANVTSTCD
jgi:hypothetical protein